jgi:hypothetical protein
MLMRDIRQIAADKGFRVTATSRIELVRSIQRHEGHFDCFATDVEGLCDQLDCLWREDCSKEATRQRK